MRLRTAILVTAIIAATINAQALSEPETLVRDVVERITSTLRNSSLGPEEKDERVVNTISPLLDFQLMAKLSLGKNNWSSIDNIQRSEFTDLFREKLQLSYLEKMNLYNDEEVLISPAEFKKGKVSLPTTLISNSGKISVIYKLYKKSGFWKVYDIEIEGISVVSSYRSQYVQALQDGNFNQLLAKMKETMPDSVD